MNEDAPGYGGTSQAQIEVETWLATPGIPPAATGVACRFGGRRVDYERCHDGSFAPTEGPDAGACRPRSTCPECVTEVVVAGVRWVRGPDGRFVDPMAVVNIPPTPTPAACPLAPPPAPDITPEEAARRMVEAPGPEIRNGVIERVISWDFSADTGKLRDLRPTPHERWSVGSVPQTMVNAIQGRAPRLGQAVEQFKMEKASIGGLAAQKATGKVPEEVPA